MRSDKPVRFDVVMITDECIRHTRFKLDKNDDWSIFQTGEETVIHPFPKSYSSSFGVNSDSRNYSNINFIYFS